MKCSLLFIISFSIVATEETKKELTVFGSEFQMNKFPTREYYQILYPVDKVGDANTNIHSGVELVSSSRNFKVRKLVSLFLFTCSFKGRKCIIHP